MPTELDPTRPAGNVARGRRTKDKPDGRQSLLRAATHAFAASGFDGADLRTIQLLLGHRSLNTTANYLRLATSKVCATASPLDALRAAPTTAAQAACAPA